MARRRKSSKSSASLATFCVGSIVVLSTILYIYNKIIENLEISLLIFTGVLVIAFACFKLYQIKLDKELITKDTSKRRLKRVLSDVQGCFKYNSTEFEYVCADILTKIRGYRCSVTVQCGDGGKDIICYDKDGYKRFVEVKLYTKKAISREQIQKLHSAMVVEKADSGIFMTTSRYSKPAIEYAKLVNIELIDANIMSNLIKKYNN